MPDIDELQRLGVYDPSAPDADDRLRLLTRLYEIGASTDDIVRAGRLGGLGSLSLDLHIRPEGPTVELDDFIATSGLDGDLVRRLWLALGLPDGGDIPLKVTPDAAGALHVLVGLASMIPEDSALALARLAGSSMARIAEGLSGSLRIGVEVPSLAAGTRYSDVVDEYSNAGRDLLPLFLDALAAVFRRHLVLVSYQLWSTDEEQTAVTLDRTVGFADVVGSTELVRAGSVAALTRMVRAFEEQVWDVVTRAGGRVVKLIGDEAMFVIEDPASACRVAVDIVARTDHPVRVGLAHGRVAGVFGDYYGETVNLAARLVTVAEPSTIVVSESVRERAAGAFTFAVLPEQALKGFDAPVRAHRLERVP